MRDSDYGRSMALAGFLPEGEALAVTRSYMEKMLTLAAPLAALGTSSPLDPPVPWERADFREDREEPYPGETLLEGAPGREGPYYRAELAVKDNIAVAGAEMSCGSLLLEGYRPPEDAEAVRRLQRAGAWVPGKTNMDEFAMGSYGLRCAYGPVRNPRNITRCAGGSSSGSAAAVAGGLVPLALGSDTGGSVRIPAAWCGVIGFKPSWGAVSRRGLVSHAASMDAVGLLAAKAGDCRRLFDAISGFDPGDPTSFDPEPRARPLRGLRVGLWEEQLLLADPPVQAAVEEAARLFERAGARVTRLRCPAVKLAGETYVVLAAQEAVSCLARFDGLRFGRGGESLTSLRSRLMGPEVRGRLSLGSALLSMEELRPLRRGALCRRAEIRRETALAFQSVDLLLGPTAPGPAPLVSAAGDEKAERKADALTVVANLAELPALAFPLGEAEGMPLSVHLMGRRGEDRTMLAAAQALEEGRDGL